MCICFCLTCKPLSSPMRRYVSTPSHILRRLMCNVYMLSISCKDQLLTGGSYHLRFGHHPSRDEVHDHQPNPHAEAELFFHSLLCHGRLADALPALVSVLRDTVPVLEVLACIPARAIPKAAGCIRKTSNALKICLKHLKMPFLP